MRVNYSAQAIESLKIAVQFYKEVQKIPYHVVDELITRLFDRADALAGNPYAGQRESILSDSEKDYRRVVEGNFKILYYIDNDVITITDFFDTRQNPDKMKT